MVSSSASNGDTPDDDDGLPDDLRVERPDDATRFGNLGKIEPKDPPASRHRDTPRDNPSRFEADDDFFDDMDPYSRPRRPATPSIPAPDVVQRGPAPKEPRRSKLVSDIWDEGKAQATEDEIKKSQDLEKGITHKPVTAYIPKTVFVVGYKIQVAAVLLVETAVLAAALIAASWYAIHIFFAFDILEPRYWQSLQQHYAAGRPVPWTFVAALIVPVLLFLGGAYKIFCFCTADGSTHVQRMFRPIFAPFRLLARFVAGFARL